VSTFLFLFLKTSKLKVIFFPQQKTRKSICSSSCLFALHIFLFSLPDALLSQSCFLQFGDARSQISMNELLVIQLFYYNKVSLRFQYFSGNIFLSFSCFFLHDALLL